MEDPSKLLNGALVLEYAKFDSSVENRESALRIFDAGPGEPKPVKALAICQRPNDKHPEVLYLYYCTGNWEVDRLQAWNWPGGGPKADTTEVLKIHAATRFTNLKDKWVKLDSIAEGTA